MYDGNVEISRLRRKLLARKSRKKVVREHGKHSCIMCGMSFSTVCSLRVSQDVAGTRYFRSSSR
jgi:hypothetical protein